MRAPTRVVSPGSVYFCVRAMQNPLVNSSPVFRNEIFPERVESVIEIVIRWSTRQRDQAASLDVQVDA